MASSSYDPSDPFADLNKLFEQFQIPGVDMRAIMDSRRKDMEALMAANVATFEAVQTLATKQTEILTQAMQNAMQIAASGNVADPAKQAELVRTAYEKAVADMKDMAEMARKAQADVMEAITARAQQSLKEIQALMQPNQGGR